MKKVILVPDSFKGSLSSTRVCAIMEERVHAAYPECKVLSLPVADGGEGSVDCFLHSGGERVKKAVSGPFGRQTPSFYGIIDGGKSAVIEVAACAGLPLVEGRENPALTTTLGVGELMLSAAEHGCKKLILCLGGSCTNDTGAGAAAACGVMFYNKNGESFVPTGGTLCEVERIDASGLSPLLRDVSIVAMCDVDNPLYGETGAAHVFAPQKGANSAMVHALDDGLRHISGIIKRDCGIEVSAIPGGGAAGGMGAGLCAFFGAKLQMGIDVVLGQFKFDTLLDGADMVFTGEGRLDSQTLRGKVIIGVARKAKQKNVPVVAVVGDILDPVSAVYEQGVSAVFSINRVAKPFAEVRARSAQDLALTMDEILRLYRLAQAEFGGEPCRK